MEEDEDPPSFWLQPSSANRRSSSSLLLTPSDILYLLLLLAASLAVIFLILPSSAPSSSSAPSLKTHQAPKPTHSLKKGWDYLNLVLVLFAIICGFLSRNGNGDGSSRENAVAGQSMSRSSSMKSTTTPTTPYKWYYEGDAENRHGGSFNRMAMRSSFSYPDLRQESAWTTYAVDRRRFYDDTHIDGRDFAVVERIYRGSGSRRWSDDEEEVKNVVEEAAAGVTEGERINDVDQLQPLPESPLLQPSPPSPPPLPAVESLRKPRRTHQAIPQTQKDEVLGDGVPEKPPSTPPPPPPPPPPPLARYRRDFSEEKSNRNGKKRIGSTSATKEFFHSLGKKKKQRQRSIENFEALLGHPSRSGSEGYRLTLSPPPPTTPPHSVFHNLFSSKKSRNRNRKTDCHSPPLPPPSHLSRRISDISRSKRSKNHEHSSYDIMNEGNRSPLIPVPPPPPPPPPFRVPEWKFVVVHGGDYVKIKSADASRSNSPDITEDECDKDDGQSSVLGEGSLTSPMSMKPNLKGSENVMFCPSPDVDTKADKFIARFREGLKLEKMHSWKERQGMKGRSNLGPPADD